MQIMLWGNQTRDSNPCRSNVNNTSSSFIIQKIELNVCNYEWYVDPDPDSDPDSDLDSYPNPDIDL